MNLEQKVVSKNSVDELNELLVDGWYIKQLQVVSHTVDYDIVVEQKYKLFAVLERKI